MNPRTLRARLVIAAGGPVVAAVAFFCAAAVLLVRAELRGSLDGALRTRAVEVAQLAVSAPAVLTSPGALESPISGRQIAVEVLDSRGRILARSLTLGAELLPANGVALRARVAGKPGFESVRLGGREFRLYAAPVAQAGGPASGGVVLVASDTTDISSTVAHLTLVLVLSGAGLAVLALLGAALLTRQGLRPLRRLVLAGAEIERTPDPSRRLPRSDAEDEIGQLTGVLNRMLASLERAQASERRFLADASHELRTPVTTLLGNVEFIRSHGADPGVLAELEREAIRLARLVDDLLMVERAGDSAGRPVLLDLNRLVQEVVAAAGTGNPRVRLERLDQVQVNGERDALARALENLIENALVHGPRDGHVAVKLVRAADRALLSVSDQGPGPDPRDREQIFERFWRAPQASGRPGSGLGLSIVSAIVDRHGGHIGVEGATFTIELPLAAERENSSTDG